MSDAEHNKRTSRKKKIVTLNVIKKFCKQARNILTNLSPNPTLPAEPGQTYNSVSSCWEESVHAKFVSYILLKCCS